MKNLKFIFAYFKNLYLVKFLKIAAAIFICIIGYIIATQCYYRIDRNYISVDSENIVDAIGASEAPNNGKLGLFYSLDKIEDSPVFYGYKKYEPYKGKYYIVHNNTYIGEFINKADIGKIINIDGTKYQFVKTFTVLPTEDFMNIINYIKEDGYIAIQVCEHFTGRYKIAVAKIVE